MTGLGEFPHQRALLIYARLWSMGLRVDTAAVARARAAALAVNHRRYLRHVPVYAAFAGDSGPEATMAEIRRLIMSDDVFKSYDPALPVNDLPGLTRWLGSVFAGSLDEDQVTGRDLGEWRASLRRRQGSTSPSPAGRAGPRPSSRATSSRFLGCARPPG
ncbi:hypothetical protein [Actinomadura sp. 6N118]|uniref:hypothetical protein n=1 Tax=Actinomadura sp. 6N118 TaxID=3375151 RepID=UPI0037BB3A0F